MSSTSSAPRKSLPLGLVFGVPIALLLVVGIGFLAVSALLEMVQVQPVKAHWDYKPDPATQVKTK